MKRTASPRSMTHYPGELVRFSVPSISLLVEPVLIKTNERAAGYPKVCNSTTEPLGLIMQCWSLSWFQGITAVQNCWLPPSFVSLSSGGRKAPSGPWSEGHGTFSNKNLPSTSWEQPRVIAIGVCCGNLLEKAGQQLMPSIGIFC